ncbi:hypothetical protein VSR69_42550 [Paraburkholderia phytofirmans]|uniref:hypothetical protein n=1 Tax=Paraburkholderia sp. BL9I2N2 TaxID=1938809 RepID=UPI00104FFE0C|nr:hypothetical protein [Paraburkholderia sp. BL9I2N2]TCK94134.1 hypothetical protein B0G74_0670 [Paraburkholderia sp. BL9I2N2]
MNKPKVTPVGPPAIIPAAPGTIAYTRIDDSEYIEPVIAFSIEVFENVAPDGHRFYTHFTTVLSVDGEISEYTAIALPDGSMALEHAQLQTLQEYREARKLARK